MRNDIHMNHMEIYWHDYAKQEGNVPISKASLTEKASVIGRTGLMLLSCGTGAWRVRNSMNTLSEQLGITCSVNIGLMSIDYTCFDGENYFSQSLCLSNTGVNTSKLNRLENFVNEFPDKYIELSGEQIHSFLDSVDQIHGLYSSFALGMAAAIACGVFGFSIMFNSPVSLAAMAALIGSIANTLRLELVDYTAMPPAVAAFCGSLAAGLLASLLKNRFGYPRIAITVPSVVIMIPGLYIYRAVYNLGTMSLTVAADWFSSAMLIILALPLGLIFARMLTDKTFRYCT